MQASGTIPSTCSCGGRIYLVRDTTGYCGRCGCLYAAHDAHVAAWLVWSERAAIIEYDGGLSRDEAEKLAGISDTIFHGLSK